MFVLIGTVHTHVSRHTHTHASLRQYRTDPKRTCILLQHLTGLDLEVLSCRCRILLLFILILSYRYINIKRARGREGAPKQSGREWAITGWLLVGNTEWILLLTLIRLPKLEQGLYFSPLCKSCKLSKVL